MTSNLETLTFGIENDIGILTINRPAKLNAINAQVMRELKFSLVELARLPLRGLIVIGEGEKAFVAGADIAEMRPMSPAEAQAFGELGHQVTLGFEHLPYPVVACVNGFALGGGFELAMACDFILASRNAVFGLPEVKLGLLPGFGGTQRLSRIVGERRAKEIMFSGRNVSSEEARNLGIVLELFEDKAKLLEGAKAWFKLVQANSGNAIAQAKQAMWDESIAEGLKIEAKAFGEIFQSKDMIEGTTAFVEKRKPNF